MYSSKSKNVSGGLTNVIGLKGGAPRMGNCSRGSRGRKSG